jgi:hypothetical protein
MGWPRDIITCDVPALVCLILKSDMNDRSIRLCFRVGKNK